jgi:hypothetical protein
MAALAPVEECALAVFSSQSVLECFVSGSPAAATVTV